MNESEQRLLDLTINHRRFVAAMMGLGASAVVEHYAYNLSFGALTNGLPPVPGIVQIQADADFVLSYLITSVILPGGSTFGDTTQMTPAGNVQLQATDTGSGHILFSRPINASLEAGSALAGMSGIPMLFPAPRIIAANTNLKFEAAQIGVTALTNPEPLGYFVTLIGSRVSRV